MSFSKNISCTELFATEAPADFTIAVKIIRRGGEPWLILHGPAGICAEALALYPAQTKFAKAAKCGMGWALRLGLPIGWEHSEIRLSSNEEFARFLTRLVGADQEEFPAFGMLAGNPRMEGRRFIILLFDRRNAPAWVLKAGIGESARQLIQKEVFFLQSAPPGIPGLPKVGRAFSSKRIAALTMEYVTGDSPKRKDISGVAKLLTGWLDSARRVRVEDIPAWKTLAKECDAEPLFQNISKTLRGCEFSPALVHGDFAPWNIKVSRTNKTWIALDWERGELMGFPGWDWFHYVIQSGILVEKLSAEQLMRDLEQLYAHPLFQTYAQRAGIVGKEKALTAAYLLHCVKIIRPTEGTATVESLLKLVAAKWLGFNG